MTEDRFLTSRVALLDQLAMVLGGRAAEELVFDDVTTGAPNDIERATAMARQMITRSGMSDKLGPRVFGSDPQQPFLGRELGANPPTPRRWLRRSTRIYRLIDEAHQCAARLLREHEQELHTLAGILIEHETIDKDQFERPPHGESERDVLTDDTSPTEPKGATPKHKRSAESQLRRAPVVKPFPGTAVARAVNRGDLTS